MRLCPTKRVAREEVVSRYLRLGPWLEFKYELVSEINLLLAYPIWDASNSLCHLIHSSPAGANDPVI